MIIIYTIAENTCSLPLFCTGSGVAPVVVPSTSNTYHITTNNGLVSTQATNSGSSGQSGGKAIARQYIHPPVTTPVKRQAPRFVREQDFATVSPMDIELIDLPDLNELIEAGIVEEDVIAPPPRKRAPARSE